MDEAKYLIEGKHLLNNDSFRGAVLNAVKDALDYLDSVEMSSFEAARLVIQKLKLPMGEMMLVLNIISPKTSTVKREFVEDALKVLAIDEPQAKASPEADEIIASSDKPEATAISAPLPIKSPKAILIEELVALVNKEKVITKMRIMRDFPEEVKKIEIDLDNFLSVSFYKYNFSYSAITGVGYLAAPSYEASSVGLGKALLGRFGHRPISLNDFASAYGRHPQEMFKDLKKRSVAGFILWTEYSVWNLDDVVVNETIKDRIKNTVKMAGGEKVLLKDLFHAIFIGVFAENIYGDVYLESKRRCVWLAMCQTGFIDYEFDEKNECFRKKSTHEKEKPQLRKMYKIFGKDKI